MHPLYRWSNLTLPPVTRMVLPVRSRMSVSGLNFLPPNIVVSMILVERKGSCQEGEGRLESNDEITG